MTTEPSSQQSPSGTSAPKGPARALNNEETAIFIKDLLTAMKRNERTMNRDENRKTAQFMVVMTVFMLAMLLFASMMLADDQNSSNPENGEEGKESVEGDEESWQEFFYLIASISVMCGVLMVWSMVLLDEGLDPRMRELRKLEGNEIEWLLPLHSPTVVNFNINRGLRFNKLAGLVCFFTMVFLALTPDEVSAFTVLLVAFISFFFTFLQLGGGASGSWKTFLWKEPAEQRGMVKGNSHKSWELRLASASALLLFVLLNLTLPFALYYPLALLPGALLLSLYLFACHGWERSIFIQDFSPWHGDGRVFFDQPTEGEELERQVLDWRKLDRLKNHPLVARLLGDNQETLDGDGLGFQALVEKGRVMGRRERNSGSIPLLLLSILGALVFFLTGYGEGICFSIVLAYAAIFAFLVEEFGRIPFIENSRWNRDFGKLYLLPIPGRTLVNQAFNRGAKLLGLLFLVGLVSILSQRLDNNERLGVVAFSLLLYFLVLMVYAIYLSSIPGQLLPKKEKGSWVWGALFLLVFPFLASILWAIIYLALRPVGFDYNSSGLILAILLILPLLLFIRFYLNDATTSYDRLSIH